MGRFFYNATCTSVIDGDTAVFDIDMGFYMTLKDQRMRFARINCWETKGKSKEKGLVAKKWLNKRLLGKSVVIETVKPRGKYQTDSFGRYIAEIILDGKNINDELIEKGHGVYQKY